MNVTNTISAYVANVLYDARLNIDRFLAAQVDQGQLHTLAPGERIKERMRRLEQQLAQDHCRLDCEHPRVPQPTQSAQSANVLLAERIASESQSLQSRQPDPMPTLHAITDALNELEAILIADEPE